MTKISFVSNGFVLAGNFFQAAQPSGLAFLLIQGWKGHQNVKAAQRLADEGFTAMTYDMRGNGESEGELARFSRADFISDALNAYDYLRQQIGEAMAIGVIGSSFGCYTATLLSASRPVHCLSLRAPAGYPDEGFDQPQEPQSGTEALMAWRKQPLPYSQNQAFQALHNFSGKVQIIEAGADMWVPHEGVQNYVKAVAEPTQLAYALMKDAPHSLVNDQLQAEYEHLLLGWVKSLEFK